MLVTLSFSLNRFASASVLSYHMKKYYQLVENKRIEIKIIRVKDSITIRTATTANPYLYNKRCIRTSSIRNRSLHQFVQMNS